jgi:hypothetical protein
MLLLLGILVTLGDEGHFNEVLPIWKPNEEEQNCQIVKETQEWVVDGDFFSLKDVNVELFVITSLSCCRNGDVTLHVLI